MARSKEFITALIVFILQVVPISVAAQQFKVGVVLPLTGSVAQMGQAVQNGLILYQEQSGNDPKEIRFIFEDSKYDGKTVATVVRKLINIDKVDLLFIWGNTPSQVAAPITGQSGVPSIFASYLPLPTEFDSNVEFGPEQQSMMPLFYDFLSAGGNQNFAALSIDIGSAISALDELDKIAGRKVMRQVIPAEHQDFKSDIMKFKGQNVKRLILFLLPDQALSFLRQAKDLHFDFQGIGGDIFAGDEFAKQAVALAPALTLVYGAIPQELTTNYYARFGNRSFMAEVGYGYSFGTLATELRKRRSYLDSKPLREIISDVPLTSLPFKQPELVRYPDGRVRIRTKYEVLKLK